MACQVVEMQPPIHADEAAEAFEEECPTDDDTLPEAFCAAEQLHCIAQFVMLPKNAEEKVLDLSCHACGRLLCRRGMRVLLSLTFNVSIAWWCAETWFWCAEA